jgi:hypothetical protein
VSAISIKPRTKPAPLQVVCADGTQPMALAQFAQALVRALMQGVQDAANLNVATVRALLTPSDRGMHADASRVAESWRSSWRTYEICATTAANVMLLAEAHARNGFAAVWNTFEQAVGEEAALSATHVARLREAFESLRSAQFTAFNAAIEAHRCLIALATEVR